MFLHFEQTWANIMFHTRLITRFQRDVDKWEKFLKYYSFKITWTASFYYAFLVFSLLCCKYICVIFIWVIWILMAYVQQQMASSTTYLFTRLQKTFSSCEPKEEWPHAGLYNYNGRQIELFHMKWFVNRLTGPRLMSSWNAWGWC